MIDNEIFLIRNQSGYILYAPLERFSARINDDCAEAVLRKQSGIAALPEEKREAVPDGEILLVDGYNVLFAWEEWKDSVQ